MDVSRMPIHELMECLNNLVDEEMCEEVGIELDMRLAEGRIRHDVYTTCKQLVFDRLEELNNEE